MPLLDDELRGRLPPLCAQEAEEEPFVHARFHLPGTNRAWYVIEGQAEGEDFVFFGFITKPRNNFGRFRLSELEAIRGLFGERVERDETFTPGRLTNVVPAPEE
ncbi:MAG: DUF2958 domain-containing protein [Bryobacteraceae bacterium]